MLLESQCGHSELNLAARKRVVIVETAAVCNQACLPLPCLPLCCTGGRHIAPAAPLSLTSSLSAFSPLHCFQQQCPLACKHPSFQRLTTTTQLPLSHLFETQRDAYVPNTLHTCMPGKQGGEVNRCLLAGSLLLSPCLLGLHAGLRGSSPCTAAAAVVALPVAHTASPPPAAHLFSYLQVPCPLPSVLTRAQLSSQQSHCHSATLAGSHEIGEGHMSVMVLMPLYHTHTLQRMVWIHLLCTSYLVDYLPTGCLSESLSLTVASLPHSCFPVATLREP